MQRFALFTVLAISALVCNADDAPSAPATPTPATATAPVPVLVPEPAWSPRPPRSRPAPPAVPATATTTATTTVAPAADPPPDHDHPAQFSSDAQWDLAGYNNNEVIYTIFITNHDSRIIRCSTELQGFYYEDGKKLPVADRQSTTVFPDQRVQAGNWQGMDEKSGVTYAVKCHPV